MIKTERQRLFDIELEIRACLNVVEKAYKINKTPWSEGHSSGLRRALDFVAHARIEQAKQEGLFSDD